MARPRQVSDDDILCVARVCFLEHGPAVSTTRIAEMVGVSQAALFKRFGTKEELMVRALAPPAVPPWLHVLESGPDERPIREQLHEVGLTLVSFFSAMTPCMSILRASGIDLQKVLARYEVPPPVLGHKALSEWFQRAIDSGRLRETDAETMAYVMLGSFQTRAFLQHVAGFAPKTTDPEAYVTAVVDVVWKGVEPLEVS